MISRVVCTIFALCERAFAPAPPALGGFPCPSGAVTCTTCGASAHPDPTKAGWDDQGWHVAWKGTRIVETQCPGCLAAARSLRVSSLDHNLKLKLQTKLTSMHRRAQAAEGKAARARARIERLVKVVDEARAGEREARKALADDEATKRCIYAESAAAAARDHATQLRSEVIQQIAKLEKLEADMKAETARREQAESILEELRGIIGNVTEGTPAHLRQLLAVHAEREERYSELLRKVQAAHAALGSGWGDTLLTSAKNVAAKLGPLQEVARLAKLVMVNEDMLSNRVALRAALDAVEAPLLDKLHARAKAGK